MSSITSPSRVAGTPTRKERSEFFKKTQKFADNAMIGSLIASVLGRSPTAVAAGVGIYAANLVVTRTYDYFQNRKASNIPSSIRPAS